MMFFQSEIIEVSFRVGDYDHVHFFALVSHLQRRFFIELWQFRPCPWHRDLDSVIFRVNRI